MPSLSICSVCGKTVYRTSTSASAITCRRCRAANPVPHGLSRYRYGCRCGICRSANARACKDYSDQMKTATGKSATQTYRPASPKACPDCGCQIPGQKRYTFCKQCGLRRRGARAKWIDDATRLAVFERDGWVCQICGTPTAPLDEAGSPDYPTLDHIEPVSLALLADNSPRNLRCAHRSCNSRRGNRAEVSNAA